jgi:RNA polymerase sigma-70 factor (ECF subfamily)
MTTEITRIWSDFHKELKGHITRVIKHQTDADDILQEVFIKIMLYGDKVQKAKDIRQYIYGIVRNTISDYFRKKHYLSNDYDIASDITEEDEQHINSTIAECCIKPFVNQLPEKYKEALLLTEFQEISQKDLAEKLNLSYSGAKSRVQRGKEKLKEMIMSCCAFESDLYGNLTGFERKNCNCT